MQDAKIKLQAAFNRGYVPKDIKQVMGGNGLEGQVWIIEPESVHGEGSEEVRLGVGYKILDASTKRIISHVSWYDPEEVEAMLKEL